MIQSCLSQPLSQMDPRLKYSNVSRTAFSTVWSVFWFLNHTTFHGCDSSDFTTSNTGSKLEVIRIVDLQRVDVISSFISDERFHVSEQSRDVIILDDSVSSENFSSQGSNFSPTKSVVSFCQARLTSSEFSRFKETTDSPRNQDH
jgi:hypothetical protein